MMNTTQPRNATDARRQAACFTKAKTMIGYKLESIGGFKDLFIVVSPEGNEYGVDVKFNRCDCPDFVKHGGTCKHILWAGLELERQDEAAMWEAQCAEYDRQQEEEGGKAEQAAFTRLRALLLTELTDAENRAAALNSEPFAAKSAVRSWADKADRCKKALRQMDETLTKVQVGLLTL